ncbi:MAG: tRNA glutamyl-Q(34) synthetase GluQRS [Vicinamibacterales bacterium]
MRRTVGRLAPTPSGDLHLGNVCAFLAAWLSVRAQAGRLLLRVEDVDMGRARREIEDGQRRDLEWLGLTWDAEVPRQSSRDYAPALARLSSHLYRCRCSRAELAARGGVYPGTCRDKGFGDGALRFRLPDATITFEDRCRGTHGVALSRVGDPVLRRRDATVAYMLAVVADDMADGVTEVVRGADLMDATAAQIAIWRALGAVPPAWGHTPLVLGPDGAKLSKSHGASSIRRLREAGWQPDDVWRVVLPWLGLAPQHLSDAVEAFSPSRVLRGPIRIDSADTGGSREVRWHEAPGASAGTAAGSQADRVD